MSIKELQLLVKEGEHTTLEFKRKVAYPDKIVKEIVAFANTRGGNLLIGVNDDGNLSGLKYPEEEDFLMEKAIASLCRPTIRYDKEYIRISDKKTIIRYYIHEGKRKPYFILGPAEPPLGKDLDLARDNRHRKQATRKRSFFRVGEKSIQASRELREILRRQRRQKDIRFIWGEKEQKLLQYLQQHRHITVAEFSKLTKISRYQASKTLVLLVLANVLRINPLEKEDVFLAK